MHSGIAKELARGLALTVAVVLGAAISTNPSLGVEHANPAKVHVWQENLPDRVVYHYRVINLSKRASITQVSVGYDHDRGIPVLTAFPTHIRSPDNWTGRVITTEEAFNVDVQWERNDRVHNVEPGQEQGGFALELPAADDSYRSFYTLIFDQGAAASGRLLPDPEPRTTGP